MYYGKHSSKIRCELFLRESDLQITCQTGDEYLTCKKFDTKKQKEDYQKHHCLFGCVRCEAALKAFDTV